MSYQFNSLAGVDLTVYGHNEKDGDGNPAGGKAYVSSSLHQNQRDMAVICWQDGPVNREANEEPNGAFVEDIIAICIERLNFYQTSPFNCPENAMAIENFQKGNELLLARRKERQERQVEGKNEA